MRQKKEMGKTLAQFKKEQMRNPNFAKEYEKQQEEFERIRKIVKEK